MYRLLVLCALVAFTYAGQRCCSMGDRRVVLEDWKSVWSSQFTGRRIAIAQAAFEILFKEVPETQALFKRVNVDDINSPQFAAHCIRVVNGLSNIINNAVKTDVLAESISHLGKQHAKIDGLRASYFPVFRNAVASVLEQAIPCFNKAAFNRCISAAQEGITASLSQ